MEKILGTPGCPRRRSPHGERGLKLNSKSQSQLVDSRSPHGERGLKSGLSLCIELGGKSLPSRGAWIEISADGGV